MTFHPWNLSAPDGRPIDFYYDRPLPVEMVVKLTAVMADLMEKMPELTKLTLRVETEVQVIK